MNNKTNAGGCEIEPDLHFAGFLCLSIIPFHRECPRRVEVWTYTIHVLKSITAIIQKIIKHFVDYSLR